MSRYSAETLAIVTRPVSPYDWVRWNSEDIENETVHVVVRNGDEDTVWASRDDALESLFPSNSYGGYAMEYIINECEIACAKCAREHFEEMVAEGQTVTDHDIYGESTDGRDDAAGLYCECGYEIIAPYCSECLRDIYELPENFRYFAPDSTGKAFCGDCMVTFRENFRNYDPSDLPANLYHRRYAEYVQRGVYYVYELDNRMGKHSVGYGTPYYDRNSRSLDLPIPYAIPFPK